MLIINLLLKTFLLYSFLVIEKKSRKTEVNSFKVCKPLCDVWGILIIYIILFRLYILNIYNVYLYINIYTQTDK